MKVLKFGGTSVGSRENIGHVLDIVRDAAGCGPITVVVSAFGGVTDQLIRTARMAASGDLAYKKEFSSIVKRHGNVFSDEHVDAELSELKDLLHGIFLIRQVPVSALDLVMSFGERLSAYIIAQLLRKSRCKAEFCDARKLVMTDARFGSALVDFHATYAAIRKHFKEHTTVQIVTGFIGSTEHGETTTLGRGGSDFTASIFGAALKASEIQIWTDVDGVMTADPRFVKRAFPIERMTYVEAMEMSHFGAKVIHPPTMQPAMDANIPILIKNTMNPGARGTLIDGGPSTGGHPITGVSSISDIALLRLQGGGMIGVPGVSERLFGALAREHVSVILISQASSEHSICFAVAPRDADPARRAIESAFELEIQTRRIDPVIVETDLSILAIIGNNMRHRPGISGTLFGALGRNGINVVAIAQGSSELNISVVIPRVCQEKALNVVHDAFFLSGVKTVHVFLVGVGLIGGTFLEQLGEHADFLRTKHDLCICVAGLANSKHMVFGADGVSRKHLQHGEPMSMRDFAARMIGLNLANSIFADCTSSDEVAGFYSEILGRAISIVTPNKRANSGPYARYRELKECAVRNRVKFLYETNVGAGLPLLSTLHDLIMSGDEIIQIEAVLSGTLSYIFNSFDGEKPFCSVVREAQEKGYTEPDPRDDLNGLDVGRKLLILAREIGLELELADIDIENLVPLMCRKTGSVTEFFEKLQLADGEFALRRHQAMKRGEKLCYIAILENGKASVRLRPIGASHPFFSLSGSDNIVSFTTKRYCDRPLVVRGPGAGADVTAAGVFADVVRVASYLT